MKFKSLSWLVVVLLSATASVNVWAQGAVTCTAGNVTAATGYSVPSPTTNVTQWNFDVTCVRNAQATSGTVTYAVAAGNGANATGLQNRARNAASFVNYEFYREATCTTKWEGANTIGATTVAMGPGISSVTPNAFWLCIPALQTPTAPSVVYADTVALSITGTSSSNSINFVAGVNGVATVNIIAPVTCTISTAPGPVAFGTYTSLGAAAVGSTSFAANCSNTLPYTMSLGSAFGVVVGLNYSVGLTATVGATTGTPTLASTGTGVAQTFYIKGNMAAGQAGSCAGGACGALRTDPRVLTITF